MKVTSTWPAIRSLSAGAVPLYGTCVIFTPMRDVEHLAGEMRGGAGALRGVVQLAGIGLDVGEEFLAVFGREIRPHHQHVRNLREHRDDLEALHLVVHLLVEIAVDRERRARRRHQRVAVGRRVIHGLGADIAAGAGTVLDHEGLPELLAQALRHDPGRGIDTAACRDVDDNPDRLVGIVGLRVGRRRRQQQCRRGDQDIDLHRVPLRLRFLLCRFRYRRRIDTTDFTAPARGWSARVASARA